MNRLALFMVIAIPAAGGLLNGCSRTYADENTPILPQGELVGTAGESRIYIFIDQESHNICYITERYYAANGAGGISCVPLAYSNLHQESSDAVSYR